MITCRIEQLVVQVFRKVMWLMRIFAVAAALSSTLFANDGWFEISRSAPLAGQGTLQAAPLANTPSSDFSSNPSSNPLSDTTSSQRAGMNAAPGRAGHEPSATTATVQTAQTTAELQARSSSTDTIQSPPVFVAVPRVATENIDMFIGEIKVLGRVDVTRVAIGNGAIIKAEVLDNNELLVIAESVGSTSLRLWHRDNRQSDYNIRVAETDPQTRVRLEKMVHMRVRMVEFRRSALDKLGVDWSDNFAGPGVAAAGDLVGNAHFRPGSDAPFGNLPNTVKPFSTYFGIASNITSRINLLASSGDATTLAEPVLSTVNGGSASFLAGGEVPYPTVSQNGQAIVEFKEYGIKLTISPSIDEMGHIRTLVDTEISQLDPAVSVQGAPGLLTRRIKTQVNVRAGETIVLSGLLSSESSKDVDKVPGIGRLPIIGNFFRSSASRNSVSELVVFLTPVIADPGRQPIDARQQQMLEHAEQTKRIIHQRLRLLD